MGILWLLAFSFLKIGLFGFGGGFAMIPLMHDLAVVQNQWLTNSQFSTAIALGQVTPGPVAISATFIGYKVAGIMGAFVSTLAIFLPSLAVMFLLDKFYLKIQNSQITQSIMHGMLPIMVGLILSVSISLGKPAVHSIWQSVLIIVVMVLALSKRLNYGFLILGSMVTGILFTLYS